MPAVNDTIFTSVSDNEGWPIHFARPFFTEWARWENTKAKFNPLATTQDWENATAFNDNNGNPVKNYTTIEDGIGATEKTLTNGYYPNLNRALQEGRISHNRADIVAEINLWGTGGFASLIASGWNPEVEPAPEPTPALTLENVYEYVNALNTAAINIAKKLDKEPNLKFNYTPVDADGTEPDFTPRINEDANRSNGGKS